MTAPAHAPRGVGARFLRNPVLWTIVGLLVLALLALMSMISLNLGILNLMPIPVLDGGHILILALEGIARRDFSIKVKEKMLLAGFVVLMMLMVTVIYNDLARLSVFERLNPWK